LQLGYAEGIARSAASLATLSGSLKDLKHEQPPEVVRRNRLKRFDGRSEQNPQPNTRSPRPLARQGRTSALPPAPVPARRHIMTILVKPNEARGAVLDEAHVGHIHGAFGTILHGDVAPP